VSSAQTDAGVGASRHKGTARRQNDLPIASPSGVLHSLSQPGLVEVVQPRIIADLLP
jgi:hypothetical protein